jgi:phytoene dehydrogenase-like protein
VKHYDAVIVGAGPNGLAAALVLARRGLSILLVEANEMPGGGARSAELTLPGFVHDTCSAIHPLGVISPVFRTIELEVEWVYSPFELAHPLDDGSAVTVSRSVDQTAERLGADQGAYRRFFGFWTRHSADLFDEILRPIRVPRRPLLLARFAASALQPALTFAMNRFEGEPARSLFAGCAAHSILPLTNFGTTSFGVALALSAHVAGWPCARGGSGAITRALVEKLRRHDVTMEMQRPISTIRELPPSRAILFDLSPRQVASIAGDELPRGYARRLSRFRHGPGVFKIDWALDGPIPWRARECAGAMTVHLGGSIQEIAESERDAWQGRHSEHPFVLLAQQSLFDSTRAPAEKQVGWAYCHVPHGSSVDMTERVERQVERFAPGFRDRILARHTMTAQQMENHDAAMVGGDIAGGANDLAQLLMRPTMRLDPYATPNPRLFLCSSSTPPGGGVHGMCGYWAAQSVLRRLSGATRI